MVANKPSSPTQTIAPEKRATLSAREVHHRLKESLAELQHAERNVALWFAEVVRRKTYKELGYSSTYQYADLELGFKKAKTAQFLRLVESFKELPALRRSVTSGELSWTKAREVAKVAIRETEDSWIREAKRCPTGSWSAGSRRRNGRHAWAFPEAGRRPWR